MSRRALVMVIVAASACRPSSDAPARNDPGMVAVQVGGRPLDLVAHDVDGDGSLDLVSADAIGGTISIRLRRGDRWVAPGDPLRVGLAPHMIALGDSDGDGDLDLYAAAHDAGGVALALGDGTGRFQLAPGSPFVAFSLARPHNHGLAVGDLDGDHDADVVLADQEAGAVAVLLADGKGGLALAAGSPLHVGGQLYPPALGDLDGDGRLDLVAPMIEGQAIAVLLGDGTGKFRPAQGSPVRTTKPRPYAVALADLDADGALDVVAPHDDADEITILLGDGRGAFRRAPMISLGGRIWLPAVADLNGDGHVDLIGAGSGFVMVADGDGTGRFGAPRRREPCSGWKAIAADLDGDGRLDVAAPDPETGSLRIWPGR